MNRFITAAGECDCLLQTHMRALQVKVITFSFFLLLFYNLFAPINVLCHDITDSSYIYIKKVDPDSREKGILWTEGMERAGCWISFMWQKHLLFSGLCFLRGFCDGFRCVLCPSDERPRKSLHCRLSFGVNILCCKGHCCVSLKKKKQKRKKPLRWLMQEMLGFYFFFF